MKGVKLSNKKSIVAAQASEVNEREKVFNERVDEISTKREERKKRLFRAGHDLFAMLNDKTLPENKGPISKNLEKDTLTNLLEVARDINNDENEPEGNGSMAIVGLMLKGMLDMRDKINLLEYQIKNLEKPNDNTIKPE